MKHLILSAIFFASQLAWGANEPVFSRNMQNIDNKLLRNLAVPNYQLTDIFVGPNNTLPATLLDTGNRNVMLNAEMEALTGLPARPTGWTASSGTINNSTASANVNWGRSLQWTPSGASQYITGPQVTLNGDCYQKNCEISFMWKSADADYTLQILNSSLSVIHSVSLPNTNNVMIPVSFNFVPGTSLISPRIVSGSAAASINIDSMYIGPAKNLGNANLSIKARGTRSTNQTNLNPNNTAIKVGLDTDAYDPYNIFDASNGRMSVNFKGSCTFNASLAISSTNVLNNYYNIRIIKNGSTDVAHSAYQVMTVGTSFRYQVTSMAMPVQPGEYYELFIYGAGNNSTNHITAFGLDYNTWLAIDCTSDAQNVFNVNTLPSMTNTKCEVPSLVNEGFSSTGVKNLCWRKNGDRFLGELFYMPNAGSGSGSGFCLNLPSGIVIDTNKISINVNRSAHGTWNLYDNSGASANTGSGYMAYVSTTQLCLINAISSTFTTSTMQGGNVDLLTARIDIPVVGWNAPAVEVPLFKQSVVSGSPGVTKRGKITGTCSAASSIGLNYSGMGVSISNAVDGGPSRTCNVTIPTNYFTAAPACNVTAFAMATAPAMSISSLTLPTIQVLGPDSDFTFSLDCEQ